MSIVQINKISTMFIKSLSISITKLQLLSLNPPKPSIITASIKNAWLKRTTKLLFHIIRVPTTLNKGKTAPEKTHCLLIYTFTVYSIACVTRISTQYFATLVFSGVWLIFFFVFFFLHKHAYKINLKKTQPSP